MTRDEIRAIAMALRARNITATEADVALALVDIDVDALRSQPDNIRWELWDGVKPINGVNAQTLRAAHSDAEGVAYVVYIGDQAVLFQPFAPGVAGYEPMTEESAAAFAETAVAQMRERRTFEAVIEEVARRVETGGLGPEAQ